MDSSSWLRIRQDTAVDPSTDVFEFDMDGGATALLFLFAVSESDSCNACLTDGGTNNNNHRSCIDDARCDGQAFKTQELSMPASKPNQVPVPPLAVADASLDGRRLKLSFNLPLSNGASITSLVLRRQPSAAADVDAFDFDYVVDGSTTSQCNDDQSDTNRYEQALCFVGTNILPEPVEKFVSDTDEGDARTEGDSVTIQLGSWRDSERGDYIVPATTYKWRVLAVNDQVAYSDADGSCSVDGAACPWSDAEVVTQGAGTPDQPSDLSSSTTATSLTLNWRSPNNNGLIIVGYVVTCTDVSGYLYSVWRQDDVVVDDTNIAGASAVDQAESLTLNSLAPGTEYECQVVAYNSFASFEGGRTAKAFYSDYETAVTVWATPEAIDNATFNCQSRPSVFTTTITSGVTVPTNTDPDYSYRLTWTPSRPNDDAINDGDNPAWRYKFRSAETDGSNVLTYSTRNRENSNRNPRYDFPNVEYNTAYNLCATPVSQDGTLEAAWSCKECAAVPFNPPAPVVDQARVEEYPRSFVVEFQPLASNYGYPPDSYSLVVCETGSCSPRDSDSTTVQRRRYACQDGDGVALRAPESSKVPPGCAVPTADAGWIRVTVTSSGADSSSDVAVDPDTQYLVAVRAESSAANGKIGFPSTQLTATTSPVPVTPVLVPGSETTYTDSWKTTMTVSWAEAYSVGGRYASKYYVHLCDGSLVASIGDCSSSEDTATVAEITPSDEVTCSGCSYTYTGLTPDTVYYAVLVGEGVFSEGGAATKTGDSSPVQAETVDAPPEIPSLPSIDSRTTRSVSLLGFEVADDNGKTVSEFVVKYCLASVCGEDEDPSGWADEASFSGGGSSQPSRVLDITGLEPAEDYLFKVLARNDVDLSPASEALPADRADCTEAPDVVTGVAQDIAGTTSEAIALTWVQPASNGVPISKYRVDWTSPSGGGSGTLESSTESITVSSLLPGYDYFFTVEAYNGVLRASGEPCGATGTSGGYGPKSSQTGGLRATATEPSTPGAPVNHNDNAAPTELCAVTEGWSDPTLSENCPSGKSITIKWYAPFDNGDSITLFTIRGANGDQIGSLTPVGVPTEGEEFSWEAEDLEPITSYNFSVSATNGVGESGVSPSTELWTGVYEPERLESTAITAQERRDNAITVEWVPSDGNGLPVTEYEVQYRCLSLITAPEVPACASTDGVSNGKVACPGGACPALEETIPGLQPLTEYDFKIRSYNGFEKAPAGIGGTLDGWSDWSDWVTFETTTNADLTPPAPEVSLVNHTATSAALTWLVLREFPVTATPPISRYKSTLTMCAADCNSASPGVEVTELDQIFDFTTGENYLLTLTDLLPATTYEMAVTAGNSDGFGPTSDPVSFTTDEAAPGAPEAPALTAYTNSTLSFSWLEPRANSGGGVTGYSLRLCSLSGDTCSIEWLSSVAAGTTTILLPDEWIGATAPSLVPGGDFSLEVRASNSIGDGDYSDLCKATVAAPPSKLDAPIQADDLPGFDRTSSIFVTWLPPSDAYLQGVAPQVLRYHVTVDGTEETLADGGPTQYILTGAAPATSHTFAVKAENEYGVSDISDETTLTSDSAVPSEPSAPTFGLELPDVTLTVDAASIATNGHSLTYFQWQVKEGDDIITIAEDCSIAPGGSAYCVVASDVTFTYTVGNNNKFSFRVRAYNSLGASSWSDYTAVSSSLQPAAPTMIDPVVNGPTSITFAWTAASGSPASTFTLQVTEGDCNEGVSCDAQTLTVPSITTSYTKADAAPATSYSAQVLAINDAGASAFSEAVTAVTMSAPPSLPPPSLPPPLLPPPSLPPSSPPAQEPNAPRNLARGESIDGLSGSGYIPLKWDPPDFDGGAPVLQYCLSAADFNTGKVFVDDSCLGSWTDGVPRRDYIFTDSTISPGQTFTFTVRARNSIGLGAPASTELATEVVAPDQMDPPVLLREEPIGAATPSSITIGIKKLTAARTGGEDITSYEIYQNSELATTIGSMDVPIDDSSFMEYTVDADYDPFQSYTFTARALSLVGDGPHSDPLFVAAKESNSPTPTEVTVVASGADWLEVSWKMSGAPAARRRRLSEGGNTWDGFKIILICGGDSGDCDQSAQVEAITDASACVQGSTKYECTLRVEGARPNTEYTVGVQSALNGAYSGTSPLSDPITTDQGPPQPPGGLELLDVTETAFKLQWLQPRDNGQSVSGYVVTYRTPSDTAGSTGAMLLDPSGARLNYSVIGSGELSGLCDEAPGGVGPGLGENVGTELNSLQSGTSYTVVVVACNSLGPSSDDTCVLDHSGCSSCVCAPPDCPTGCIAEPPAHTYAVPDRPKAATLLDGSSTSLTVGWELPYSHGSEMVSSKVTFAGSDPILVPAPGTSYSREGLDPATSYPVEVSVTNGVGSSELSATAWLWTNPTEPGKPSKPGCSDEQYAFLIALIPGQVVSNGKDVDEYFVETWPADSNSNDTLTNHTGIDPSQLSQSCGNLGYLMASGAVPKACDGAIMLNDGISTPSSDYSVRMKAHNALGWSAWSDTVICSTVSENPRPFPWVWLIVGLSAALVCMLLVMLLLMKTNLRKVIAPKLRKKPVDDEPLKTFVTLDAMPNEEDDPEIVMNPILMARLAMEAEKEARGTGKKKRAGGGVGRTGGLRRLNIQIDESKEAAGGKTLTGKAAVDKYLADQAARDSASKVEGLPDSKAPSPARSKTPSPSRSPASSPSPTRGSAGPSKRRSTYGR